MPQERADSRSSPSRRTQAQRTALSDRRMLDAAIELICDRGPTLTTLQSLGNASGYSRGLVTYRFGSKAGLFEAVVKEVSQRWLATLNDAVAERDGMDAVLATIDAYRQFLRNAPRSIRAMNILFFEAAIPGSSLAPIVEKIHSLQHAQLKAWIEQGKRDGDIRTSIDANVEAANLMSFFVGTLQLWMLGCESIPFDRVHKSFKDQLIATYTPANQADAHTKR